MTKIRVGSRWKSRLSSASATVTGVSFSANQERVLFNRVSRDENGSVIDSKNSDYSASRFLDVFRPYTAVDRLNS